MSLWSIGTPMGNWIAYPSLPGTSSGSELMFIVVSGTRAAVAAKQATSTIPIVLAGVGDPVQAGLVSSLLHPRGATLQGCRGFHRISSVKESN